MGKMCVHVTLHVHKHLHVHVGNNNHHKAGHIILVQLLYIDLLMVCMYMYYDFNWHDIEIDLRLSSLHATISKGNRCWKSQVPAFNGNLNGNKFYGYSWQIINY